MSDAAIASVSTALVQNPIRSQEVAFKDMKALPQSSLLTNELQMQQQQQLTSLLRDLSFWELSSCSTPFSSTSSSSFSPPRPDPPLVIPSCIVPASLAQLSTTEHRIDNNIRKEDSLPHLRPQHGKEKPQLKQLHIQQQQKLQKQQQPIETASISHSITSMAVTSTNHHDNHDNVLSNNKLLYEPEKISSEGAQQPRRHWKTAVDPSTGRTYYYDAVTRQTQWDKPEEIRAKEIRAKIEKRRLLESFFDHMRKNVLESLGRGELIPGIPRNQTGPLGPPLEPLLPMGPLGGRSATSRYEYSHSDAAMNDTQQTKTNTAAAEVISPANQPPFVTSSVGSKAARIRTISGMNEKLLVELQNPRLTTNSIVSAVNSASTVSVSAPSLPVVTISKPNTIASLPMSTSSSLSVVALHEGRPPLPRSRSQASRDDRSMGGITPNSHSYESLHVQPSQDPGVDMLESFELSPEELSNKIMNMDTDLELEGEHLLDGPLLYASSSTDETSQTEFLPISQVAAAASHIRRNTGGTVFVQSTMENPDVNATIKCVCGVYRAHIVSSAAQLPSTTSESRDDTSTFGIFRDETPSSRTNGHRSASQLSNAPLASPAVPSLGEIEGFYMEFFRRSQMEHDTIIMSLIYVERLIKETMGKLTPSPTNWKSILFSCMVLSSKVWDDLSMFNLDFSNVSMSVAGCQVRSPGSSLSAFSLQRTNALEVALLQTLNFNVRVAASEYAKYYFLIRTMLIRSGLLDESGEASKSQIPISLNISGSANWEGRILENRSRLYQDQLKRRAKSVDWKAPFPTTDPVLKDTICMEQLLTTSQR